MWNMIVIAFVLTAAVADLWWRKIPRKLTVAGFLAGLAFHWYKGDLRSALAAAAVGFVIGLALFNLGAIGGGDVKLITALGAMLGFRPWSLAMEVAILAAAVMAVVQVIRRGALRNTLRNMVEIVVSLFRTGFKAHPALNVKNAATLRSPFGVAAAIGTVFAVLLH